MCRKLNSLVLFTSGRPNPRAGDCAIVGAGGSQIVEANCRDRWAVMFTQVSVDFWKPRAGDCAQLEGCPADRDFLLCRYLFVLWGGPGQQGLVGQSISPLPAGFSGSPEGLYLHPIYITSSGG